MATKAKKTETATAPKPRGKMVATFAEAPEPDKAAAMAQLALRPSVNAAAVMTEYTQPLGEQDIGAVMEGLCKGIDDMWAGDMKRAEAMLYGQAHALQSIFMNLARRATKQDYLKHWEAYLRMALKAQNQCRMTLETLATLKNPPIVYAKQANINNGGQQQVNNGGAIKPGSNIGPAPASDFKPEQTELLEQSHGQGLDTGTTRQAGGADSQLEAVGEVHRAAQ